MWDSWTVVCLDGDPRELEEVLSTKGLKIKFAAG